MNLDEFFQTEGARGGGGVIFNPKHYLQSIFLCYLEVIFGEKMPDHWILIIYENKS